MAAPTLNAATRIWVGTTGDWSDPNNWGGTEPIYGDTVTINNNGTAIITQNGESCLQLNLNPGIVQISDGSLTVSSLYLSQGFINQLGGSVSASSGYLGYSSGSLGEYDLSSGELDISYEEYIGYSGKGIFNQSGGSHSVANMYLGKNTSSSGQYILSGTGQLVANIVYVGGGGSVGNFIQTGGSCTINQGLQINGSSSMSSTYTLDGTGKLNCGWIYVGNSGQSSRFDWFTNDLTTSSFIVYSNGTLAMGFDFDLNDLLTGRLFHGTHLSLASGNLEITRNATAIQSSGTLNPLRELRVGTPAGEGTYILSDNAQLSALNEYIGSKGRGTFIQTGGINTINGKLVIGSSDVILPPEEYGIYTLKGTGELTTTGSGNYLIIGKGRFEWFRSGGLTTSWLRVSTLGTLAMGFDFDMASLMNYSLFNGSGIIGIQPTYNSETAIGNLEISNGSTAYHSNVSTYLSCLNVGSETGNGIYQLSGTALLQASGREQIGLDDDNTGLFQQTGGTNKASLLTIGKSGRYELKGGTLVISYGFRNEGILDCGNSSATLSIPGNSIVDLSKGSIVNAKTISLNIPSNSILIVAPDFDPDSIFLSYSNSGLYHTAGTPLVIDSGKGYGGMGSIDDPVICRGSLIAKKNMVFGYINLNNGLLISNGSVDLKYGYLICDDDGSGISNGSLYARDQYVGKSANGSFFNSSGTNSLIRSLYIGYSPEASGTYDLSGTGQVIVTQDYPLVPEANEYIGFAGTGIFNQSAGTNKISGSQLALYLGYNAGSSGTYNLSGGQLTIAKQTVFSDSYFREYIGYSGIGVFNQSAGKNELQSSYTTDGIYLGYNPGSKGTYNLSGTGQLNAYLFLGYNAGSEGVLNIKDSAQGNMSLYLGYGAGSQGSCNISGGTINVTDLFIGLSGSGAFTQSGGEMYGNLNISIASNPGSRGTYDLNGGILRPISITSGLGTAAFNFGGGTIRSYGALSSISAPLTLTGINGNAILDIISGTTTISGHLSGPGGLNKLSAGILSLSANNDYFGPTTVTAGTLALASTGSIAKSNIIDVASGATFDVSKLSIGWNLNHDQILIGSGTILGDIILEGNHAPGNPVGIETIQGNYSLLGQLQIDLKGRTAGTGYDQVLLKSVYYKPVENIFLSGLLALDWSGMNGSTDTTQLWILKNDTPGTLSGAFSNYANGALLGNHDGRDWYLWYGADAATGNLTGGNDVVIAAVPEPAGIVLLGLAAMGMYFAGRKQR